MGVVYQAILMMAWRLKHVNSILQQDAAERALNKLARTFATQMEALNRYQRLRHALSYGNQLDLWLRLKKH